MRVRRQSAAPFSTTPHGLWTIDAPHGARVLLGWLHSHTDEFLASLSFAAIARLLDTQPQQIRQWCARLEELGLLTVERGANGTANAIVLTDAYWSLGRPSTLMKIIRDPDENHPGNPDENHPAEEHQGEDHLVAMVDPSDLPAAEPVAEATRATRRRSARDDVWDAVIEVCGLTGRVLTSSEQTKIGKVTRDLLAVEATPDEVRRRAAAYRRRWPRVDLTPTALLAHWNQVVASQPTRQTRLPV